MKREPITWTVGEHGVRPAGKPDECFYCQEPVGAIHLASCVIRQRTVVINLNIEVTVLVPEDWTPEQIEFHRNQSSFCASNILDEIRAVDDGRPTCLCGQSAFTFVREATAADEARDVVHVAGVPS